MKHVSILPLNDSTLTSIDSTHQMLTRVNDFMEYQKRPRAYDVNLVGLKKDIQLGNGKYNVQVDNTLDEVTKTDVIVLPLLCGSFPEAIKNNKGYEKWVKQQYQQGAEIVCLCVGSFFLASIGLLDGRKCSVHWAAKNEFRIMFPSVQVLEDTIITDENGIYTCGGGYSYLNLLLYIIEKHTDKDTSILASKMFEIDIARKSQNPFMIFLGQKNHGDDLVLRAQLLIESNPTASITIENLCDQLNVARRTFERRFKKGTDNSILEYIQRVKVEVAKKHLETGKRTINEIVYDIGYTDIDAFRKLFRKYTDMSPLNYRKRFAM